LVHHVELVYPNAVQIPFFQFADINIFGYCAYSVVQIFFFILTKSLECF